jgi:hypothetical protein
MKTILLWGAAALGAGYLLLHKAARFLGDKAKVGDDVFVPVSAATAAAPGLPAGLGSVMIHVTSSVGSDVLTGPITGGQIAGAPNFIPLPAPTAPVSVQRAAVVGILRNGKSVV